MSLLNLYKKLGVDEIGKAIAEAIANKKIEITNNNEEIFFRVIAGSYKERANAEKMKMELEKSGFKGVFLEAFKK